MPVERDDVAVGQLGGILACRRAVRDVDVELTGSGTERAPRRRGARAFPTRVASRIIWISYGVLKARSYSRYASTSGGLFGNVRAERALRFAEDRATTGVRRQVRQGILRFADDHHVEMFDPCATRRVRHHVPVVERLQVDDLWPLARRVNEPAAGIARQRQPRLELRIDRVRIVAIVECLVVQRATGHHEMIETAALQRDVGAALQHVHVAGI